MGGRCIDSEPGIVVWATLCNLPHRVIHSSMSALILSITGLVLLAALVVSVLMTMRVFSRTFGNSQPRDTPEEGSRDDLLEMFHSVANGLATCDLRIDRLTKAVADGIDHVDRNEKRVRGIVTGAKRRFDAAGFEDPGTAAEVESLPEIDEASSPEEELQAVREGLELDPWASVPGMTGE